MRTPTSVFRLLPQPTDTSCGPTCLHGIYGHHGRDYDIERLLREIPQNEDGGTLSVHLAIHALRHGFAATTFSYNLRVFDPTWATLDMDAIRQKLDKRLRSIRSARLQLNHRTYIEYLQLGGLLRFDELTPALLAEIASHGPALVGLSATHLYRDARQRNTRADDINGMPEGHFVVFFDYDADSMQAVVADPYSKNPFTSDRIYRVNIHRFINAIMLGIVTYDANILLLQPR